MIETEIEDPVNALKEFENVAAELAADYESKMIRFWAVGDTPGLGVDSRMKGHIEADTT